VSKRALKNQIAIVSPSVRALSRGVAFKAPPRQARRQLLIGHAVGREVHRRVKRALATCCCAGPDYHPDKPCPVQPQAAPHLMPADDNKSASGYRRGEWSTKPDYLAECLTCGWKLQSTNAQGPAAIHARRHKHNVHVEVFITRVYNHEP